jgi:hypothetical protein
MPKKYKNLELPPINGPTKQPIPRNKLTRPVEFVIFSRPTMSHRYTVVKEFIPAKEDNSIIIWIAYQF